VVHAAKKSIDSSTRDDLYESVSSLSVGSNNSARSGANFPDFAHHIQALNDLLKNDVLAVQPRVN
jgi:hypothetical protein